MKRLSRWTLWATLLLVALTLTPVAWGDPDKSNGIPGEVAELREQMAELNRRLTETEKLLINVTFDLNAAIAALCEHLIAQGVPPLDICPINALPSKSVFLTSQSFFADLGGLQGADAKCQAAADASPLLSGTYKAWLSTSGQDARDRMFHNPGPYKLPTGVVVAENWGDLVDGTLHHAIDVTEKGTPPTSGNTVWTATDASGQLTNFAGTCDDWTSVDGPGGANMGLFYFSDSNWTQASGAVCDSTKPIYCFEQ